MLRAKCSLLPLVVLAVGLALARDGMAQQAASVPFPVQQAREEVKEPEALGTGETLGFLGRKMWFEVRRRLNLTTTEEEKAQREAERSYRLRVGGIKVEK